MNIYYLQHRLEVLKPQDGECHSVSFADFNHIIQTLLDGNDVVAECRMRDLYNYCHRRYIFVKAAGGVVEAPDGKLLMIHRDGQWDLPKGMVEEGETLGQAAIREVAEETGISELTGGRLIGKTYHIYDRYGGWHLKQTSWFAMTASSRTAPLLPQEEEGIDSCEWVDRAIWRQRLCHSFGTLRELAQLYN